MTSFDELLKQKTVYIKDKHVEYDKKIAKKILEVKGIDPKGYRSELNEEYQACETISHITLGGLVVRAAKLDRAVNYATFTASLVKSEVLTKFKELIVDYDGAETSGLVLVFDRHGDGIGDMIITNSNITIWQPQEKPNDNWMSVHTMKLFDKETVLTICSLNAFLEEIK